MSLNVFTRYLVLSILLGCCCSACGPRDIGTGTADSPPGYHPLPAEDMRYPVIGSSSIQHRLYYMNRPSVMEQTQRWKAAQYRRHIQGLTGSTTKEEPPTLQTAPTLSPFRQ